MLAAGMSSPDCDKSVIYGTHFLCILITDYSIQYTVCALSFLCNTQNIFNRKKYLSFCDK